MDMITRVKACLNEDGTAGYVGVPLLRDLVHYIEELREDAAQDKKYMEQLTDEITRLQGRYGVSQEALAETLTDFRGQPETLDKILTELRELKEQVRRLDV